MSEMLANQYFISERYSEALEEYSKLPKVRRKNIIIKEKMIISATLDENFEVALPMLHELIKDKFGQSHSIKIDAQVCPCIEVVNKLESQNKQGQEYKDVIKMKIAILTFFSDQDKSLEIFKELKGSVYADIVTPFFNYYIKISK